MKKFVSILMCTVLCLYVLASCGGNAQAKPLADIYESVLKVENMPEMTVMPDELITAVFGFDTAIFEEYVFAEAASPDVYADVIVMAKVADKANIDTVSESLDTYLYSIKEYTESYSPENFEKTADSRVTVAGNCVYLIITDKYFEAEQIIIKGLNASAPEAPQTVTE